MKRFTLIETLAIRRNMVSDLRLENVSQGRQAEQEKLEINNK